jgi:hypothetical protein
VPTPLVQQRAVLLPPAITILSQVLLGVLFGALGVLMATPLAATILNLALFRRASPSLFHPTTTILLWLFAAGDGSLMANSLYPFYTLCFFCRC